MTNLILNPTSKGLILKDFKVKQRRNLRTDLDENWHAYRINQNFNLVCWSTRSIIFLTKKILKEKFNFKVYRKSSVNRFPPSILGYTLLKWKSTVRFREKKFLSLITRQFCFKFLFNKWEPTRKVCDRKISRIQRFREVSFLGNKEELSLKIM